MPCLDYVPPNREELTSLGGKRLAKLRANVRYFHEQLRSSENGQALLRRFRVDGDDWMVHFRPREWFDDDNKATTTTSTASAETAAADAWAETMYALSCSTPPGNPNRVPGCSRSYVHQVADVQQLRDIQRHVVLLNDGGAALDTADMVDASSNFSVELFQVPEVEIGVSEKLGLLVQPMPSLRVSLSALHSPARIDALLEVFAAALSGTLEVCNA
jgi:hypothetical protein